MPNDLILRLNPMQVRQLAKLLDLAEHHASNGLKDLAFVAQQCTQERVDFIDLQLAVQELYRSVILTEADRKVVA